MLSVKKIKPMFTGIITTANKYDDYQKEGSLIDVSRAKGDLKMYQTVVAVGTSVRDIKVGDVVMINPIRYSEFKHQEGSLKDGVITDNPVIRLHIPMVEINGVEHLMIQDRDVDYIIEDYEEKEDEPSSLYIPPHNIIMH